MAACLGFCFLGAFPRGRAEACPKQSVSYHVPAALSQPKLIIALHSVFAATPKTYFFCVELLRVRYTVPIREAQSKLIAPQVGCLLPP